MITLLAALFITSPLQSFDPGELPYSDTMTSTDVTECRETFCEEWEETSEGLLCFDSDELYARGHYHFEVSPEFDVQVAPGVWEYNVTELQAFTEY